MEAIQAPTVTLQSVHPVKCNVFLFRSQPNIYRVLIHPSSLGPSIARRQYRPVSLRGSCTDPTMASVSLRVLLRRKQDTHIGFVGDIAKDSGHNNHIHKGDSCRSGGPAEKVVSSLLHGYFAFR
jgi:hypothetical protein